MRLQPSVPRLIVAISALAAAVPGEGNVARSLRMVAAGLVAVLALLAPFKNEKLSR